MRLRKASQMSMTVLAMSLLAACGGDANSGAGKSSASQPPDREWTDAARVEAIASTLQACSYGGGTEQVQPASLNGAAPGDCRTMVDKIMGFTGLPANFVVTSGPVENALAVIMLDKQREAKRVIAFNPDFIQISERLTGGDPWAPVSIMAHEIGHHLSGHTITSGGSRPSIELEADKFSGYVLYRMGATQDAATKAIMALVGEQGSRTHPGRDQRADAIRQGWAEACRQAGGNCSATAATPAAQPIPAATPASPPITASLPVPATKTVPFKYGRFVVDETGKLDAAELAKLDAKLRDIASKQGTEIAFLVVNDLHGMSAQDYAWAMLRQLRVGKLDLGNGGVIVVAPAQGQTASAYAPGVAKMLEFNDALKPIQRWIDQDWSRVCAGAQADAEACRRTTSLLVPSDFLLNRLREVSWKIRYDNVEDVIKEADARRAQRKQGQDPDQTMGQHLGALARFTATVVDPRAKPAFLKINERIVKDGRWQGVLVKTPEGREVTLYMQPQTATVMPSGALQKGKSYTFVGQLHSSGQFTTDKGVMQGNVQLWGFSYDALD